MYCYFFAGKISVQLIITSSIISSIFYRHNSNFDTII
nr:MAG TPA: hypothetical protein [Caudoviricetes sp.]DAM82828.1 MAG TPA: hypothetical protein [Caudoviricetes sp.]